MIEFKVGDRVEIIASGEEFSGRFGTIRSIKKCIDGSLFRVAIDGVRADGIQAVPPYAKDEIRHVGGPHD